MRYKVKNKENYMINEIVCVLLTFRVELVAVLVIRIVGNLLRSFCYYSARFIVVQISTKKSETQQKIISNARKVIWI